MKNLLLETFKTDFESTPFSKINIEHFIPALKITIKNTIDEINLISSQKELPSFLIPLKNLKIVVFLLEEIHLYFSI